MHSIFLSREHVDAVKARAAAGEAPWAEALAQLLADGQTALTQPVLSICQNGGSKHFRQDAVYVPGHDGVVNPQSNRESRHLATRMGETCLTLAMCWRLTGEGRYADKALQLAHAWCLDRATCMFAEGRVDDPWTPGLGYGGDITLFGAFHDFFLACHILDGYPGWEIRAHAAVRRWIRAMVEPQRPTMFHEGVEMYNNLDDSRCVYLLNGALALDDLDLAIEVFQRWAHTLPVKMTVEGELPRETMRATSMGYTLLAVCKTLHVGHVGERFGVGLLDLNVNGRTIRKAVDYVAHHLLHPEEWPFRMIKSLPEQMSLVGRTFEVAYRQWGDPTYLDVLKTFDKRPVRFATLLYGSATAA